MIRGTLVRTWFDTGALGAQMMYGVVVKAGPKTYTVEWESGNRNRIRQDANPGIHVVDRTRSEWAPRALVEKAKGL